MTKRREFTSAQKRQIVERSKRNGKICCEGCGLVLAGKPHEIDHIIPEALRPDADKQKPIAIAEGQLLGKECCHRGEGGKTNKDVAQIAKSKRQFDKNNGVVRSKQSIQSRGFEKKAKREQLPMPPRVNRQYVERAE